MGDRLKGIRSILVVRNDRLGDAILALPVVSTLKAGFPDIKVGFLASSYVAPLLKLIPAIDQVYVASDKSSGEVAESLQGDHYDLTLVLRATFSNALGLSLAGIPHRAGTSRRAYSILFNDRLKFSRRDSTLHEADLNLEFCNLLNLAPLKSFPRFDFPENTLSPTKFEWLAELDREARPVVLLHPGTGGSAREWPLEYFKGLAAKLKDSGRRVVVTGSPQERSKCVEVAGDEHINLAGETNLVELAAVIQRCSLLVAGSTGPLHLAVALGRPVVGLYPPVANCTPERWGPYLHPEWALSPDVPTCTRCRSGQVSSCWCMEQITTSRVFDAIARSLPSQTSHE